jgi:hypothetical protein
MEDTPKSPLTPAVGALDGEHAAIPGGPFTIASVFDTITEPVLVIDRNYEVVMKNAAAAAEYDWTKTDRHYYCYRVTHSVDRPCIENGLACPVHSVFATGESTRVVHVHTSATGAPQVEEVIASPLRSEGGEITHVVEEIRDLSKHAEEVIERLTRELKILHGLLPMCASCKMIRDQQGEWIAVDRYIADNSEANFTHGLCPACVTRLYPKR